MERITRSLVVALLFAVSFPRPARSEPRLQLGDSFIPFLPGVFLYDRNRGTFRPATCSSTSVTRLGSSIPRWISCLTTTTPTRRKGFGSR